MPSPSPPYDDHNQPNLPPLFPPIARRSWTLSVITGNGQQPRYRLEATDTITPLLDYGELVSCLADIDHGRMPRYSFTPGGSI